MRSDATASCCGTRTPRIAPYVRCRSLSICFAAAERRSSAGADATSSAYRPGTIAAPTQSRQKAARSSIGTPRRTSFWRSLERRSLSRSAGGWDVQYRCQLADTAASRASSSRSSEEDAAAEEDDGSASPVR